MANFWFRLYKEFSTDPKIQMLSEAYQRRFIMLLCNRCGKDNETFQDSYMAFQMRISESEWAETKKEFIRLNLCDSHNNPTNWDKWQYKSDSSTERVRRFREKNITLEKRDRNVSETPQSRVDNSRVKKKKTFSSDSVEVRLSNLLLSQIRENNPEHKEPNIQEWAVSVDRMIRLDKRDPQKIANVIAWCQKDNFWHAQILSTGKLREQYDKLFMQMSSKAKKDVSPYAGMKAKTQDEIYAEMDECPIK